MGILHEDLIAYLDGELTPERAVEVEQALAADPALADRLGMYCRQRLMLAEVLRTEPVAAVAPSDRSPIRRRSRVSRRRGRLQWLVLAAAACIAVAVGIRMFLPDRPDRPAAPPAAADLLQVTGMVALERAGTRRIIDPDEVLQFGDTLHTGADGGAGFVFRGETTTCMLEADAVLALGEENGAKRLRLIQGMVEADVAPQPPHRPLVITSSLARAEVQGTRLRFSAAAGSSRLEVTEGLVRFIRLVDSTVLEVGAGFYAEAAEGIAFEVRPLGSTGESAAADPSLIAVMDPAVTFAGLPAGWHAVRTLAIDEGTGQRWRVVDGRSYNHEGPVLLQDSRATRAAVVVCDTPVPSQAVIEGSFRLLEAADGGVGIYTRYHDAYTHYGFGADSRGNLDAHINCGASDPDIVLVSGTAEFPLDQGWHTVRIELDGPQHVIFLDGREYLRFSDNRISDGTIALLTHRARAIFGRFTVKQP